MRPDETMRIAIDAALEKHREKISDWEKGFLLNLSSALTRCLNNPRATGPTVKQKSMVRAILKRVESQI